MKRFLKITTALFLATSINFNSILAQDCSVFFPSKEGSMIELTQYDAKNKVTGITKQAVISKESTGAGIKINFKSESFSPKGESLNVGQYAVKCENGIFYFDMNNFLPKESMGASKDAEIEMKADNLDFPSNPEIGKTLGSGTVKMIMKSNGMTLMEITITISDRKVEAIENITTPAGTFECYKVTFRVLTHMMFDVETVGVQWVAKNVGVVKMENYDKKGKLTGTSLLTAIKN
jgi:uncharacterized protein (DUF2141 family)